jgi:HD-GYP domain-containing protein (c-di-GMP phosphodiesterase class II)
MQERISVQSLHIGMFVADLDRPWLDTPFPIQGFLVESPEQIKLLREFCEFVVVDWMRSAGEYATRAVSNGGMGERQMLPRSIPSKRPLQEFGRQPLVPAPVASLHKGRSVSFWEHMREVLVRWGERKDEVADAPAESRRESVDNEPRPSFLPRSVPITYYANTSTVGEELPNAESAYARTGDVLNQLIMDIRGGKNFDLEGMEEVVGNMVDSAVRNPDALMWVAHLRDQAKDVYGHGLSVAVHLLAFGRHLGFPKEYLLRLGMVGLLLDLGMLKVPKPILEKTAVLTAEEFDAVREHVVLGLEILHNIPGLHPDIAEGIAQHHERENGSGYPSRRSGDQLSTFGRMAAVVDTFTAMTSKRSYREPAAAYEVLRDLSSWAGTYFNAPMVEQFIQSIGVFPAGSLVELSTGEVAVVVSHNKARRLKPKVLIITAPDKSITRHPASLDLLHQAEVSGRDPVYVVRGLPAGAFGINAREYYVK